MIEVRPRRFLILAISIVPMAVGIAAAVLPDYPPTHAENWLRSVIVGVTFGPGFWSFTYVLRRSLLTFEPATGTLRGPSLTRANGVYPRRGFGRIEFDPDSRRLYEVGPDRRRLIPIPHWAAHHDDWSALTGLLRRDAAPPVRDIAP
ncbi:hypothetical protein AB0B28_06815 [Glycomyces sp. NPDC046736]|uniref:hypothetical protein n=1 Tax=Glycomyces sp. NPDC046736 TaxID=3155615 RepID=UPI0033C47887